MDDKNKQSFATAEEKPKHFFIRVWERFKMRWVGFYLLIPAVIISFIVPFVYMSGFLKTYYMSAWAVILPFLGVASFVLAFFKPTARFAPFVMFTVELAGLLVFIKTAYMHLTTAFFGGISGNVLVQAGFSFSFCTLAYVLNIVICITALCFKQYREEKDFFGNAPKPETAMPTDMPTEE
ncbi:MAG: hypothetical protein J1F39_00915 [Clostridiales bacterium]|nr:hypothetical protein [Clostridiales bacterium]